jgi:enoyl-CoA hydratase
MKLDDMPQEKAKEMYITKIENLLGEPLLSSSTSSSSSSSSTSTTSAISEDQTALNKRVYTLKDIANPIGEKDILSSFKSGVLLADSSTDGVVNVTLNRPHRGNAFNIEAWVDFKECFEAIHRDENSRVVVLSGGENNHFSTGMDLSVFAEMQKVASKEPCEGRKREALSNIIQYLQDSISSTERCKVPVIAAVHGNCIGGAVDLITACDLRYCTEDAIFCIKETDLAMVADIGTTQRLPRLIGDMQTRELAYTGRDVTGKEAEKLGLVLKCFPTYKDMMNHVESVANSISKKSPLTIRGIKKTLVYSRDHSVIDSLDQVKMHNSAFLYSNDLLIAMQAGFEKQKPVYPNT